MNLSNYFENGNFWQVFFEDFRDMSSTYLDKQDCDVALKDTTKGAKSGFSNSGIGSYGG